MRDRWSGLAFFYKIAMFLIILGLLTMIIGLILIATTNFDFLGISRNGFDYLKNSNVGDVLKNSAPIGVSNGTWMQLQWGVGLAIIATPILFGSAIISIILGFFAIGSKN